MEIVMEDFTLCSKITPGVLKSTFMRLGSSLIQFYLVVQLIVGFFVTSLPTIWKGLFYPGIL